MEENTIFGVSDAEDMPDFGGGDDGSLAFLKIPKDPDNKSFICKTVTQTELDGKEFWVVDYADNIRTRHSGKGGGGEPEGKTLVLIKYGRDDPDSKALKFFTGSRQIQYVLHAIRERDAFPRRVTLKSVSNRFYFE